VIRVLRGRKRRDEGFSLIEVIIAAVILGFVSVALLNGLNTVNLTSRLQHTPTQEYANLATAQVLIQRTTFTACSTNANPYAALNTQLTALKVSIVSVKGIPANDTTKWDTCGNSWPVDGSGNQTDAPTVLQQITLQATIGRLSTRTVFKASNGAYPVGSDGTSVFSVTASIGGTATNVINIPSGCSPSLCATSASLAALALPSTVTSSNLIYFVMGSNPTGVVASVSNSASPPTASITEYRNTDGTAYLGSPWVLLGAFDKTTNTLARPVRVYENMVGLPTLSMTYPTATPTYFTAIAGYGFYPTTQTPTATATLPAGYTTPAASYSTTSSIFSVNSSTGVVTIPAANVANLTATTPTTISVPIKATCCSFTDPNAQGVFNMQVRVTPALGYSSSTVASACTTSPFSFKASSAANPCVITTVLTGGSGSAVAAAATNTANFNVASSTYTAATNTVTTSIYYKNNGYCKTGTTASLAIGDLTFTDSGTTQTVTNSAAIPTATPLIRC